MARPPSIPEIDDIVAEQISKNDPGVAVAVIEKGQVVHLQGYGLADVSKKTPITPATVFDLASVSKQFTAAAILLLASRGKLSVDDSISSHLAQFKLKPKGRPVLVRDLLWHISGLADYSGDDWEGTDEEFENLTNEAHVLWINGTKSPRAPGKKYEYNNSGYALLARIVEEVSGQKYSAFVAENIFRPLGMSSTLALDDLSLVVPHRARGYKEGEVTSGPTVIQGDGNIFTSAEDMVRWDKALRDGSLLDKKWLKKAWTNGVLDDGSPIDAEGAGYGFGWCIEKKTSAVSHDGSWDGTATCIIRYLSADLTVITLSNDEDTEVDDLCRSIAAHFGADEVSDEDDEDDDEDDEDEDDEDEDDEDGDDEDDDDEDD